MKQDEDEPLILVLAILRFSRVGQPTYGPWSQLHSPPSLPRHSKLQYTLLLPVKGVSETAPHNVLRGAVNFVF